MNKQYYKVLATLLIAAPLVINSVDTAMAIGFTGSGQIIPPVRTELPKIYINNDRLVNEQDGTDVRVLTTTNIVEILKKYDLINHPEPSAQIILEKLYINYENGLPVKATSQVGESRIYKLSEKNTGISSIELYTEYGNTDKDGYDSMTYIKFIGDRDESSIFMDVLNKVFLDTYEITGVMHEISKYTEAESELTFNNCIVGIKKGMRSSSGIQSVELKVYENKGVHNGKILDTVRVSELEQLCDQKSFEEIKNYSEGKLEILNQTVNLDKNEDFSKNNEITSIIYERAWTHAIDDKTKEESKEFNRYYMEKEISYNDWSITTHIDDYDRFNIGRKYFVIISGIETKPFLENKAKEIFGNMDEAVYNYDYTTENFKSFCISEYNEERTKIQ